MLSVIMAGGLGKRLRPLTDDIPKPMVEVGGRPIIYWQIKWLQSCGVDRFVLLAGYKAEKLISYIKSIGYYHMFKFSIEKEPLGSAGAIKNASRFLESEESFIVSNGDNITNQDISRLKLKGKFKACMALAPYRSSKGIVLSKGDIVTKFNEKPLIRGYWFNAGTVLLSAEVIDMLPNKGSMEQEIYPNLAKQKFLACVKFEKSYFNSIDSVKDRDDIDKDLKSGRVKF